MPTVPSVFQLPPARAAKSDPALLGGDEQHFSRVSAALSGQLAETADQLAVLRRAPAGAGRRAIDRDLEVHRLSARLQMLRRYGQDLCLGRMDPVGGEPVYIGRLGLHDTDGRQLLIDWRTPAAEPFFAATMARPLGLRRRRRYRWSAGRITDYWDEVFDPTAADGAAPDAESAFIASLSAARSPRMRDVLATLAADQDAIIRAGSAGTLVVEGGPGTGKTVVALHRAAYLLYADPRLGERRRGGVLFVGPHRHYLAYIADVLPSLGEDGVQTATLRDLVAEGAAAEPEPDQAVAALKADPRLVEAIEPAVALYEEPAGEGLLVETPWADVWLGASEWAAAYASVEPGTPHNEAREQVWEALLSLASDRVAADQMAAEDGQLGDEADEEQLSASVLRGVLAQDPELRAAFTRSWTLIEAADLVGDLWTVPAYLRRCAPWLDRSEVARLQRDEAQAWTVSDLPLLDAARHRLGDPASGGLRRRRERVVAAERAAMDRVVDDLLQADDDGDGLVQALRQEDLRDALVDDGAARALRPDELAGPFAHVVVDEAQELTDAEWLMLVRRCPSRSFTVVGDRAQARHGFSESWPERLARIGLREVTVTAVTVNYRTPAEVMAAAEPVIRSAVPEAGVPTSIRSTGVEVRYAELAELAEVLNGWLTANPTGVACLIASDPRQWGVLPARVTALTPETAKGLEFDLVVLVAEAPLTGPNLDRETVVDRYVAMTRATQQLVVLTGP